MNNEQLRWGIYQGQCSAWQDETTGECAPKFLLCRPYPTKAEGDKGIQWSIGEIFQSADTVNHIEAALQSFDHECVQAIRGNPHGIVVLVQLVYSFRLKANNQVITQFLVHAIDAPPASELWKRLQDNGRTSLERGIREWADKVLPRFAIPEETPTLPGMTPEMGGEG